MGVGEAGLCLLLSMHHAGVDMSALMDASSFQRYSGINATQFSKFHFQVEQSQDGVCLVAKVLGHGERAVCGRDGTRDCLRRDSFERW